MNNQKAENEKYCTECGELIHVKAEICPKCGVRQTSSQAVNKVALILLAFFLGGIGAHKFYVGKNWQGFFYILFCWTGIPGLIALIECIIYAFSSTESLEEKYTVSGGAGVIIGIVVGGFFIIAMIGVLAAIAIPNFIAYRDRAQNSSVESEMRNLAVLEQSYMAENGYYSPSLDDLGLTVSPPIRIEILRADSECFRAIVIHEEFNIQREVDCNTY